MSVRHVFLDPAVRAAVLVACLLVSVPVRGGAETPRPADPDGAALRRNETVIAGGFLGAGVALVVVAGFVPSNQRFVTDVHLDNSRTLVLTESEAMQTGSTPMFIAGAVFLLLGGAMMLTGSQRPPAHATGADTRPADGHAVSLVGTRVDGRPAAGLAFAF
ncbi:hypothetical protein FJ250_04550 [bacterium]|nr:hypothetical protein [bacterium]